MPRQVYVPSNAAFTASMSAVAPSRMLASIVAAAAGEHACTRGSTAVANAAPAPAISAASAAPIGGDQSDCLYAALIAPWTRGTVISSTTLARYGPTDAHDPTRSASCAFRSSASSSWFACAVPYRSPPSGPHALNSMQRRLATSSIRRPSPCGLSRKPFSPSSEPT